MGEALGNMDIIVGVGKSLAKKAMKISTLNGGNISPEAMEIIAGEQNRRHYIHFINKAAVTFVDKDELLRDAKGKYEFDEKRAKRLADNVVGALIVAAENKEKPLEALIFDLELGKGKMRKIIRGMVEDGIVKIKKNNKELGIFLEGVEIFFGEGEVFAKRMVNITTLGKGVRDPEGLIVISNDKNKEYYAELINKATMTFVNDSDLAEDDFVCLPAILLCTLGKYLNWPVEDLIKHYKNIPNAKKYSDDFYKKLFSPKNKTLLIKLIPGAAKIDFNKSDDLVDAWVRILKSA